MSISASGAEVFMRIKQGNGTFTARDAGNVNSLPLVVNNSGSGIVDQGAVRDLAKWNAATTQPQDYRVVFKVDTGGVLKYTLTDAAATVSLFDNAGLDATGTSAQWKVFAPGQAIAFSGLDASVVAGGNLGVQVSVGGRPADGDSFSVKASQNQSIFDTIQNLISAAAAPTPPGTTGNTVLINRVTEGLANIDQSLDNVLRVRSSVGSRLAELESLANSSSAKKLEYEQNLADLEGLDYAAAISDLNKQQLQLEAAQKSFARITSLSLFNIL